MLEKAIPSQIKEDTEVTGVRKLFGKTGYALEKYIMCYIVLYNAKSVDYSFLLFVVFFPGVKLRQERELLEPVALEEDREEEISGAQFLCETVIRSLTLEEAPDHRPMRRAQHSCHKPQGEESLYLC